MPGSRIKTQRPGRDAKQFIEDYKSFKAGADSTVSDKLKQQEDSMRKAIKEQVNRPYSTDEAKKEIQFKQAKAVEKYKEKGRKLWDEVRSMRNKFLKESVSGYQDAVALMNEMFKYILAIAEALYYSITAAYIEPWLAENLGINKLSATLDSTGHGLKMKFKSAIGSPDLHPSVDYDFEIDDATGQVTTKFKINHKDSDTQRQDVLSDTDKNLNDFFAHDPEGQKLKKKFTDGFETALEVWLRKNGYNKAAHDPNAPEAPPKFVLARDGRTPLTKDAFEALDRQDSFAEFVSGYSQLEVRPSFSP